MDSVDMVLTGAQVVLEDGAIISRVRIKGNADWHVHCGVVC